MQKWLGGTGALWGHKLGVGGTVIEQGAIREGGWGAREGAKGVGGRVWGQLGGTEDCWG